MHSLFNVDDVREFFRDCPNRMLLVMNSVYFLIPGLRLPAEVLKNGTLSADFSPLQQLTEGAEEIISQQLVHDPVLDGASHIVWLWQVIGKKTTMPETAAFEWEADGGPAMGAQTWRLHSVHEDNREGQVILRAPLNDLSACERDILHDEVLACARKFGFQLQQWADRWYLTRNTDWALVVRPWCAQQHQPFNDSNLEGPAAEEFKVLAQELRSILKHSEINARRRQLGLDTVDGFWPDGGSRRHLLKPSTLRAVMADDAYVWGWAQNAGLLNFRTTPVKQDWPEAPEGDLLAVIDDLYDSYRRQDWSDWSARLPEVISKVEHLSELAHKRRCSRVVIVASGARDTHTVVVDKASGPKGLLARFRKKKTLDISNFLSEAGR